MRPPFIKEKPILMIPKFLNRCGWLIDKEPKKIKFPLLFRLRFFIFAQLHNSQKRYFIFNKPYGVLSQFTTSIETKKTLSGFGPFPSDVYPLGRLDEDSEGLILLSNDASLHSLYSSSNYEKEYWVQVEGQASNENLEALRIGVKIKTKNQFYLTLPAKASILPEPPNLPERSTPIRIRKNIPTTWISLTLKEGKNRQVRKMTAAVGFPTLRLLRIRIGNLFLKNLEPGMAIELTHSQIKEAFAITTPSQSRKKTK